MNKKQIIFFGCFLLFSSLSSASTNFEIGDSFESVLNNIKQNPQCRNLTDVSKYPNLNKMVISCQNKSSIGMGEKLSLNFEKRKLKSIETQSNGLNLGPIKLKPKEIVAWFKKYFSNLVLI